MNDGKRTSVALAIGLMVLASTVLVGLPSAALAQADGNTTDSTVGTDASWSTYRADDGRSGATTADGPGPYGTVSWNDSYEGEPTGGPVVGGGTAYLGVEVADGHDESAGAVIATDIDTGATQWERTGLGSPAGAPTVVENTVFVATSGDGGFYALDADTGETRWQRNGSVGWGSAPVHENGLLYTTRGSTLVALDPATGEATWSVPADDLVGIADGTIVVANGRELVAYDASTHEEQWRREQIGDFRPSKVALTADGLFGVTTDHEQPLWAYSLSLADGSTRWNATIGGESDEGLQPAVTERGMFVTVQRSGNDTVHRLDPETGEQSWQFAVSEGRLHTGPTVANDTVYVGGRSHAETTEPGDENPRQAAVYYAIDAEQGAQEWGYALTQADAGAKPLAPSVAAGELYVATFAYAFDVNPDGSLYELTSATAAPSPEHAPSDGVHEGQYVPEVTIAASTVDESETFSDNETVALDAKAAVLHGNVTSYEWDVDGDGAFERTGRQIELTLQPCQVHNVTVRATAARGETATDTVLIAND